MCNVVKHGLGRRHIARRLEARRIEGHRAFDSGRNFGSEWLRGEWNVWDFERFRNRCGVRNCGSVVRLCKIGKLREVLDWRRRELHRGRRIVQDLTNFRNLESRQNLWNL